MFSCYVQYDVSVCDNQRRPPITESGLVAVNLHATRGPDQHSHLDYMLGCIRHSPLTIPAEMKHFVCQSPRTEVESSEVRREFLLSAELIIV